MRRMHSTHIINKYGQSYEADVIHTVISIATNVVPSLVGVDFEFEACVWVGDLADFVLVVDEEAAVVSRS